jgi:hypothetical protein
MHHACMHAMHHTSYSSTDCVIDLLQICATALHAPDKRTSPLYDGKSHSSNSCVNSLVRVCAAVKLSWESLLGMKIKHLKALLLDRGLQCRECVEKGDFVAFLSRQLNLGATGHEAEL